MLNPNFRRRLHMIMLAFIGFCKVKRTRREWQAEGCLTLLESASIPHKNNTNQSRRNKDRETRRAALFYSPPSSPEDN